MSWQEELRKLDEELAAGRLSADDYRVRRDQVLSSAVAHGDDSASAQQQAPQQAQAPQAPQAQPQQPEQPQQPPQQPNQSGNNSADSTQVIAPVSAAGNVGEAERTQAVPSWQAQQAQQPQQPMYQQPGTASPAGGFQQPQQPHSPAGGFQQPQPMQSPAGGFQQPQSPAAGFQQPQQQPQQQQPWNAPEADQSPPWGGTDFPPIAPAGSPEWAQGPEDGFDGGSKGGKGKIFAIIGAVVVLVGIAVGAYFLFGSKESPQADQQPQTQQQQAPQSSQAPTSSEVPEDDLPLGEQPGRPENHEGITSWQQVPGLNYLNSKEIEAYGRVQPGEAKFGVYHLDNGNLSIVLLTKVGDRAAASDEVANLARIQADNGAQRITAGVPNGVLVTAFESKDGGRSQLRAHYLSGDVLVRVEANSEQGVDGARDDFDKALEAQLEVLPANG